MGTLDGKTAVVIGASGISNFGVAIARRLAKEGANVVVSGRRKEGLENIASEIGGLAVACDITDESQIKNLFDAATEKYGYVNMAINSAGAYHEGLIAELDAEGLRQTLDISFIGGLLFFKNAAAAMPDGGSVVTISSLTTRLPAAKLAVYSGARAALDHAIKVAAVEYGPQKVRFNSIAAGLINTDMTAEFFKMPELVDAYIAETPVGRMGTVEDIAEAALYLADDSRSGFVNGQVLDVSGGQHMGSLPGA